MKAKKFDLMQVINTVYGDLDETFRTPKVVVQTIEGKQVLAPSINRLLPAFDDFGITPNQVFIGRERVFVFAAIAGGLGRVCLYDFNSTNGTFSPVGSLNFQVINSPATTHTIRGLGVDDGATSTVITNWKIFISTTGSVTANGGPYMGMSIDRTDFTAVPPTIPTATLADSKQVYKLENSPFTLTASAGLILDRQSATKLYQMNGVSATYQMAKFDYSQSTGVPGANGVITTLIDPAFTGSNALTGNLPALVGTLLLTNVTKIANPIASPNPAAVLGQKCAFFCTNTTMYLGRLDELTPGGVTWPSLTPANNVSTVYLNPTLVNGSWCDECDRLFGGVNAGVFFQKPLQNNTFDKFFGKSTARFWETGYSTQDKSIAVGANTVTGIRAGLGWLFIVSSATPTRGIICVPVAADEFFGQQYAISKVLDLEDALNLEYINVVAELNSISSNVKIQYRTTGFASQTVGWLDIPESFDASALGAGTQLQIKILYRVFSEYINQTQFPREAYVAFNGRFELSDNWEYSRDQSSTTSPVAATFRLRKAYSVAVPTLRQLVYDLTGVLLIDHNSVTNVANFSYSTNNGLSYTPVSGAIPNVVGTLVKYTFTSPPGIEVRVALREA